MDALSFLNVSKYFASMVVIYGMLHTFMYCIAYYVSKCIHFISFHLLQYLLKFANVAKTGGKFMTLFNEIWGDCIFFFTYRSVYKLVSLDRDTMNSSILKNIAENSYKRETPMNVRARKLKTMIMHVVTLIMFSLTLQVSVFNYWI